MKLQIGFPSKLIALGGFISALFLLNGAGIAVAQTPQDIAEGRGIADDRRKGNCFACHQAEGAELAGTVGPPLIYMKLRYPDRQALYEQIADPRQRNPGTVMPPYGAHGILTEHELNRVVDYLLSL
ncbi:MAG: sulfur-oxidizing protein SoxX [Halieaceae bacterium]